MLRPIVDLMSKGDYDYIKSVGKFLSSELTNKYKELLPYNTRLSVFPVTMHYEDYTSKDFIHVDLVFKDAYGRSMDSDSVCNIPFSYFKDNVVIVTTPMELERVLKCSESLDSFIKNELTRKVDELNN